MQNASFLSLDISLHVDLHHAHALNALATHKHFRNHEESRWHLLRHAIKANVVLGAYR